jgi:hypothetical protein
MVKVMANFIMSLAYDSGCAFNLDRGCYLKSNKAITDSFIHQIYTILADIYFLSDFYNLFLE